MRFASCDNQSAIRRDEGQYFSLFGGVEVFFVEHRRLRVRKQSWNGCTQTFGILFRENGFDGKDGSRIDQPLGIPDNVFSTIDSRHKPLLKIDDKECGVFAFYHRPF